MPSKTPAAVGVVMPVPPLATATSPPRFECDKQVALNAIQPPEREMPFANVEVAEVPVMLRYVVLSPLANVDVAFERMVEVAVPFALTEKMVDEAFPSEVKPETVSAPSVPTLVSDDAVTPEPSVLFVKTFVLLIWYVAPEARLSVPVELKVDVAVWPKYARPAEICVVDALPENCWRTVKAFECARLIVAVMFPLDVTGEEPMVRDDCPSVKPTEVTVPAD